MRRPGSGAETAFVDGMKSVKAAHTAVTRGT
jgi:hypothetical protein